MNLPLIRAAILVSAVLASLARAADPPFECRWTDRALKLDIAADAPLWKDAQLVDNFRIAWKTGDAAKLKTSTKARLMWDREYLYFLAEMEDHDLHVKVTEHQGMVWTSDVFELFFKPSDDKPDYYEFEVNPTNTTLELYFPARNTGGYGKFKDLTHIDFKTVVRADGTINNAKDNDTGWTVEGRIPWKDLAPTGGRPNVGDVWKLNLCRMDYSEGVEKPEQSSAAPLTRPDFHRYEDFARLKFLGPQRSDAAKPFGLEKRVRWTRSRVVGFPDPPLPYVAVKAFPKLRVERPLYLLEEPGGKSFLLLQHLQYWAGPSRLLRFANDPNVDHADVLLDINRLVYGMTLHPDFVHNGYVYLIGNGPVDAKVHTDRIARYTIDRATGKIDPKSELPIIEWESNGHDGGDLSFGPDGYLYHAAGDGTADSDQNLRGQDPAHLNSTMIRIDVDHPSDPKPYSIPKDNPFINTPGFRPEVWAYGFRNPWRLAFDRKTNQLWVGQNGQDAFESVYLVRRGENYGWSVYEGGHPFNLQRKRGPQPITFPIIDHPHSEMRSLTGGVVYHGAKLPELDGAFVYGDWSTGRVWGAKAPGDKLAWHHELLRSSMQIVGFRETSAGDLLVIDEGSGIYRLERRPEDSAAPPFPRKLSETGLFVSTKDNTPDPALIPYDVNAPLWSDGASKERFIAIPGDGTVEVTPTHGFNFPEGTVLVKTFGLETAPGQHTRVETRLLTRQVGQWIGYTYKWSPDQTDATLVEAAGADQEYDVSDASGSRKQTWHFPSRAECMACHTRAWNYVLGPSLLQLNRDFDYPGGVRDNQLRALEHVGVLRTDYPTFLGSPPPADQPRPGTSTLLFAAPENTPRLPDYADASQPGDARARAYLHANCAICHIKEAGGNSLIDLEFSTPLSRTRTIDQPPQHEKFDLQGARLIAPGHPESSVLLHRMGIRGQGQMPPLATHEIDKRTLQILTDWIASMKP